MAWKAWRQAIPVRVHALANSLYFSVRGGFAARKAHIVLIAMHEGTLS